MNISTFLVLHKACSKEKIKLSDQHKDFEYMLRKEWITQVENDLEISEDSSLWILGTITSISIAIASLVIKALLEC